MSHTYAKGAAMSTTELPRLAPPAPSRVRPTASLRDDIVAVLLGTALIGGVLADAWAHTNILKPDDTFFTPWHALLYSGFASTAAWTWWLAFRRRHEVARWWRDGWPVGYALGALGTLIFFVGGAADMFWHTIFGIELGIKAALSPSHLAIAGGAVLVLTSPMRSWFATGERGWRAVTGVMSTALGTIMGIVIVIAMTALYTAAPTLPYSAGFGPTMYQTAAGLGLYSYLLGTVLLLIPFLLVHRHRGTPGAATAIVGVCVLFMVLQHEFLMPQTAAMAATVVGAVAIDAVLAWLDARRGQAAALRLPIAGALFAGILWSAHLIGLLIADGIRWPVEMWSGTVVVTAALGAMLGVLASPKRS
jgi:hypothetical protein